MMLIMLIDDGCKQSSGTYSVEIARPHIDVTVNQPYTHDTTYELEDVEGSWIIGHVCMMVMGHVCIMVMGHVCSIPSAAASLKNSNPSKMSCSRPIAHTDVMSCCYYRDLIDIDPSHLPINPSHLSIYPSMHPFIDLSIHRSIHPSIAYHVSSTHLSPIPFM